MAVTKNAIRVQLPGGKLYAPAMHQAASKIGARSGLPKRQAAALIKMVDASVKLLTDTNASTITLEMWVHDDSISATVTGEGCKPVKKAVRPLAALAEKHARSFSTKANKSAFVISFVV